MYIINTSKFILKLIDKIIHYMIYFYFIALFLINVNIYVYIYILCVIPFIINKNLLQYKNHLMK